MRDVDLTIWKMDDIAPEGLRSQIEEFIIERIEMYGARKLPAQRTFAKLNNIDPSLVKRAYSNLTSMGWLSTKYKSGTFASSYLPNAESVFDDSPFAGPLPVALSLSEEQPAMGPSPLVYDFRPIGLDRLSEHYFPKGLNKYLRYHRNRYKNITQMEQITELSVPLYRDTIRKYLNMHGKFKLNAGNLDISMGRQESLNKIFSLLLRPGDGFINTAAEDVLLHTVLHEYHATVFELSTKNPDFIGTLERLLQTVSIKVIYINSQCNYPKGGHLSPQTSLQIIDLTKKYGVYIVEENDFHEFWYPEGKDFIPLAHYDHEGHVIYTAPLSQSSVYMYNTRVIAASKSFVSLLESIPSRPYELRNIIEELAIIDIIESGELWHHAKHIRAAKKDHRDRLYLQLYNYLGDWMVIPKPLSGLCFWIAFPPQVDINKAMGYLNEREIDVPYNPYIPLVMDKVFYMRLAFATFNILEAQAAAKLLREMFEDLGIPKIKKTIPAIKREAGS